MSTRMAGTKLSAEEIRSKFGLGFNAEHAKQSHSNVQKGSDVANTGALYANGEYIGTINGFSAQDPNELHPGAGGIGDLQAIDQYAFDNGFKEKMSTGWNSYNDVANAVRSIYGGGETDTAPKAETVANTYSDKVASAKAGKAAFEDTILPSQGDYIMGKKDTNPADDYLNSYKLNLAEYKKPREVGQIDGPVYDPEAEEAAVAGVGGY